MATCKSVGVWDSTVPDVTKIPLEMTGHIEAIMNGLSIRFLVQ